MTVKKIVSPRARDKGIGVERKFGGGKFMVNKDALPRKDANRGADVADEIEVVALNEADVALIDEICARDVVVTPHVRDAIAKPWKADGV